jgi:RNA polymerase-binding protein DksA
LSKPRPARSFVGLVRKLCNAVKNNSKTALTKTIYYGNVRRNIIETGGIMAKVHAVTEQDFTAKMEKALMEQKREIISNLVAGNEDFKQIVEAMDPKDLADVASDDMDRKMIEAIGSQDLKRLRMIESALTRIQQGKYGLCIRCSRKIPHERLEAIPYALMCIECKTAEEKRNR